MLKAVRSASCDLLACKRVLTLRHWGATELKYITENITNELLLVGLEHDGMHRTLISCCLLSSY